MTRPLFRAMVRTDRGAVSAGGVDGASEAGKLGEGRRRAGEVSEKAEMRHFRVSTYPEEAELAPSWDARVARDGKTRRNGSHGGGRMTIEGGQEAKSEILDYW